MPGDASYYVAHISAVLFGSLTPRQIRRDLALCEGLQYEAQYMLSKGLSIVSASSIAKPNRKDKLR